MFMETQCYHQFHISCFKKYAVKTCLKYKRSNQGDPEFEAARCAQCNLLVPEIELKQIFGAEYEEKIEKPMMEIYLSK